MPLREEVLAQAVFVQAAFTEALFVQAAFTAALIAERRCAEAYIAEPIGVPDGARQQLERLPSAPQQQHPTTMAIVSSVDIIPIPRATSSASDHDQRPR